MNSVLMASTSEDVNEYQFLWEVLALRPTMHYPDIPTPLHRAQKSIRRHVFKDYCKIKNSWKINGNHCRCILS